MPEMSLPRPSPRTAVLAAIVVGAIGLLAFALLRTPAEPIAESDPLVEAPVEAAEPEDPTIPWPLTGVHADEVPDRPALVAKISNSPEARPHTGLELADVVIEELTEGGVTRFMAVFHSRIPDVIGPLRSGRPVDMQLAAGFDHPGFIYSGARPEVLELVRRTPIAAITEGAPGFFRDSGEYASHPVAPHNLFARGPEALAATIEAGAGPLGDHGWVFDDEAPELEAAGDGTHLDIPMSRAFTTTWEFDADAGVYRRAQNGEPSEVTGEERIGAANVVVLAVRHFIGDSGYPETDVLGEGEALVLRDGVAYAARWEKPTETDPFRVLTLDGEPFPFQRGPTWIHLPDELPPIE